MNTTGLPTKTVLDLARRFLVKHPEFLNTETENYGTKAYFRFLQFVDRDWDYLLAEPKIQDLINQTISCDTVLRRLREVREEMRANGQVRPALQGV